MSANEEAALRLLHQLVTLISRMVPGGKSHEGDMLITS